MRLWIDDVRPAPDKYIHIKTLAAAKKLILETSPWDIEEINLSGDMPINGDAFFDWLDQHLLMGRFVIKTHRKVI